MKGCFPKDRFTIDLDGKTVTCPAGVTVPIRVGTGRHARAARFGAACRACPLAARCTTAGEGRTITIGPHEARLAARLAETLGHRDDVPQDLIHALERLSASIHPNQANA